MKIHLYLCLLFCMMMSCKQDQAVKPVIEKDVPETDTIQKAKPVTDPMASIRNAVEQINTLKLVKKHFEFLCDEKMMVDYFYENDEIVKIAVDFGTVGDTYAKGGYYYRDGKLIFIYEFVEGGPACEGCIETNEYRSYIVEDKTIKYVKNKTVQPCKKCQFTPASTQYKLLKARTEAEVKSILCPN